MKNTQLKTLNKVFHKGITKTIDGILRGHVCFTEDQNYDENGVNQYGPWIDLDEIEFIPLSEEILLKCGFERGILPYVFHYKETFYQVAIQSRVNNLPSKFIFRGLGASVVEVSSLHHLQNIIHSISGQ